MKPASSCLVLVAAIALAGCVAGGVKVEERQLSSFKKGETTYGQVLSQLGQPNSSSLLSDGRRMIIYTYVQAQARPESFVPIVGAFIGGADSRMNMVSLTFTRDGVLDSYTSTQSQYGVGTGLISGNGPDGGRVPDQPRVTQDIRPAQATSANDRPAANQTGPKAATCTPEEQNRARIARMNGYTGGPKCD